MRPARPRADRTPMTAAEHSLAIWTEYRRTRDLTLRNQLVLSYVPLVKHVVYKKLRELPASCEAEELISCGIESLIAALDLYQPDKGAEPRALPLDPHPRRRARRAAPPRLGAALAAPPRARAEARPADLHHRPRTPADARGARRDGVPDPAGAARQGAPDRERRPHVAQLAGRQRGRERDRAVDTLRLRRRDRRPRGDGRPVRDARGSSAEPSRRCPHASARWPSCST